MAGVGSEVQWAKLAAEAGPEFAARLTAISKEIAVRKEKLKEAGIPCPVIVSAEEERVKAILEVVEERQKKGWVGMTLLFASSVYWHYLEARNALMEVMRKNYLR